MSTAEPYVCEHCDDSVPHQHVDEKPLVEAYRRDLLGSRLAATGVAAIGLAVLAVVALDSAIGLPLGMAAWLVATGAGLLAWLIVRARSRDAVAVIAGAITTAALSPLLALGVAALTPGPAWARGLAAGLGWLALAVGTDGARTRRLRTILTEHTREGEAARSGVVRSNGRPSPYLESGWLVLTAAVLGMCVAAAAVLPVVVAVLVPLNVALAVLSRRWQARPSR